jgi:hypothetical protein
MMQTTEEDKLKESTWTAEAIEAASVNMKKKVLEPELTTLFQKLYSIKKASAINFFKKKVDPTEEEVINLLSNFLDKTSPSDFCQFIIINQSELEIFYALSFNPLNKSKKLTEICTRLSIKLISMIGQSYIALNRLNESTFSSWPIISGPTTPGVTPGHSIEVKNFPLMGSHMQLEQGTDGPAAKPRGKLATIFSRACCFLSLIFVTSPKQMNFKIKSEKLKIFKSLESRLNDTDPQQKNQTKVPSEPYATLKEQLKFDTEISSFTSVPLAAQAVFDSVGQILDRSSAGNKLDIKTETFSLELMTVIKHKNKLFDLLDYYFDMLLGFEDHQVGYMSLMEKNIAIYIDNVLDGIDTQGHFDLDLFKQIFGLINKLFQRRKKLFGVQESQEDLDNYISGHSSSDENRQVFPLLDNVNREVEDEKLSFRSLQKTTGKLYLQMIEKLIDPAYKSLPDYNIFTIFNNDGQYVSYLEIFEAASSHKLIKNMFELLNKAIKRVDADESIKVKLLHLLKVHQCIDKVCSCFVNDFLTILFKLAMKCPQTVIASLMDMYLDLLKGIIHHTDFGEKVLECFLKSSTKMFMSLLCQNLQTVEKMTVQLKSIRDPDSPTISPHLANTTSLNNKITTSAFSIDSLNQPRTSSNSPGQAKKGQKDIGKHMSIQDLRMSVGTRRFNLFFDFISLNSVSTKLTKELTESVLLLLSDVASVRKYLGGEDIKVDLELDEFGYVTTQDVVGLVRDRWQVKLLSFRTLLLSNGSLALKEVYNHLTMNKIFAGYWEFFSDLNTKRGNLLHKFYIGYITYIFCSPFNLSNYKSEPFQKFVYILDIYLKGLGYYDRDTRLNLPTLVQKSYMETLLTHLKLKFDYSDLKLTLVQMIICFRLEQMFARDPPILKSLIPLVFDIARELLVNFDKINWLSKEVSEAFIVIQEDIGAGENPINIALCILIRLFLSVLTTAHPYSKFPVIVKPQVIASGRFMAAGRFDFATFGDLVEQLLETNKLLSLIELIDKNALSAFPQVELAKYLTFVAFHRPSVLASLLESLLTKCLNPTCLDEVFKVRMKLVLSLLTLDNNEIVTARVLDLFLDKFEPLLVSANSSLSAPKKQWFLTLLAKWVYLVTQSEISIVRISNIITTLRYSQDDYLNENTIILKSYLAGFKGLYNPGKKMLRTPSIFDESNILARSKMDLLFSLIDKFFKGQAIEEETRLLQHHFDLNLFEFFSEDKRAFNFEKLLDMLLAKVKPTEAKWLYILDSKNIILYSLAETAPHEICMIKRHIAGKICWYLEEDPDSLYIKKSSLDVITPDQASEFTFKEDQDQNLLVKLLQMYRQEPDVFDYFSCKSLDDDILALNSNKVVPTRVADFDSLPDHLKVYWGRGSNDDELQVAPVAALRSQGASFNHPELSDEHDSANESNRRSTTISQRTGGQDGRTAEISLRPSRRDALGANLSLKDARIRFMLQMGMYSQPNQDKSQETEYYIIVPDGERKERFKNSLTFLDKTRIINLFVVGILFIGPDQHNEEDILKNAFPQDSLFATFVSHLGDKQSESVYVKNLGCDRIEYKVGPLIPRSPGSTFEVKRVVGNVPTLIVWTQNLTNMSLDNIKSKFNKDIIIIEELPNSLLRIRSQKRLEKAYLEAVFKPDGLMSLECLLNIIHSYIFSSQMEINPIIFSSLEKEYKTISPYLEARKKKLRELTEVYADNSRKLNFDTLADILFGHKY